MGEHLRKNRGMEVASSKHVTERAHTNNQQPGVLFFMAQIGLCRSAP